MHYKPPADNDRQFGLFNALERYAWLCGSFIVLLLFLTYKVVTLDGFASTDKYIVVLVLLLLFPLSVP